MDPAAARLTGGFGPVRDRFRSGKMFDAADEPKTPSCPRRGDEDGSGPDRLVSAGGSGRVGSGEFCPGGSESSHGGHDEPGHGCNTENTKFVTS